MSTPLHKENIMFRTSTNRALFAVTICLATAFWAAPALGQPYNPPAWWGSDDGQTVTLGFTFGDGSNPTSPDQS